MVISEATTETVAEWQAVADDQANQWIEVANSKGLNGAEILAYYKKQAKAIDGKASN